MSVWDSPVLAVFAVLVVVFICCSIFVLLRSFLHNWRRILTDFGILAGYGAAIAIGIIGIALVMAGVFFGWQYVQEQVQMKQCLTAHERRAYADAAPDDYFGRQLRDAAAVEAKTCAELAAKKEAEAKKATGIAK